VLDALLEIVVRRHMSALCSEPVRDGSSCIYAPRVVVARHGYFPTLYGPRRARIGLDVELNTDHRRSGTNKACSLGVASLEG